jgi:hypothetical protein
MRFGIASDKRAYDRDVKVQSFKRIAPYARESMSTAAGTTSYVLGRRALADCAGMTSQPCKLTQ